MGHNHSVVKVADPSAHGAFDRSFAAPSSRLSPVTALATLGFPVHKKDANSPILTAWGAGFCLGFSLPLLSFTAVILVLEVVGGMVGAILNSAVSIALLLARCSTALFAFNWSFQRLLLDFGVAIVNASGLISKLTTIPSSAIWERFWTRNCSRCCEIEEEMLG